MLSAAREDMRLKETHFDTKYPEAGAHKVYTCTCIYIHILAICRYGKGRQPPARMFNFILGSSRQMNSFSRH